MENFNFGEQYSLDRSAVLMVLTTLCVQLPNYTNWPKTKVIHPFAYTHGQMEDQYGGIGIKVIGIAGIQVGRVFSLQQ